MGLIFEENSMTNKKRKSREMINCQVFPFWIITLIVVFISFQSSQLLASQDKNQFSVGSLGRIIVLEDGRKKPLDTYARNKLIQFSGRQKVGNLTALQWLSRVMFDPSRADDELIFLINNPEVADALGVQPRTKRRYSFSELYGAIEKINELSNNAMTNDPGEWSTFEKEIVQTNRNLQEYFYLRSSFSFLEPLPYFEVADSLLASHLELPINRPVSYYDLLMRAKIITGKMKAIQQKGSDSLYSDDKAMIELVGKMYEMEKSLGNPPPHLIPGTEAPGDQWLSVWGCVAQYKSAAMDQKSIINLVQMRESYVKGDQQKFDISVNQFANTIEQNVSGKIKIPKPGLELLYNKLNPFLFAKILYGLAALLSLLSIALLWKKAHAISFCFVSSGMLLHTSGIIIRMIIMARPPVTNLYETFVFTAWAAVLLGLVLEWMRMRSIGTVTAAVTGFLFLHIAGKYALDGDTMGMLTAVLESSFWLTTHIVTIALGYAGYAAAGLLGHIYMLSVLFRKNNEAELQALIKSTYGIFSFGFIFTIAGTIFGGMWADQAWGRFWGWDPKENGALLLILWGLIVIHCRKGGIIKDIGTAMGAVIGVMLVMCAWIGVNLLGVGLHSYGFTSGGALALEIYIGIEMIFLIGSITFVLFRGMKLPNS